MAFTTPLKDLLKSLYKILKGFLQAIQSPLKGL